MDIIVTIILSTFKFGMTFPLAIMEFRFGFLETILWINLGGIAGVYFFAYLSEGINHWLERKMVHWRNRKKRKQEHGQKKRVFTKRNRRIVRIKKKYGLWGIALSTPILLSIPVGAFLMVRYYSNVRSRFMVLIVSNMAWSLFYAGFYMFWNDLLFPG